MRMGCCTWLLYGMTAASQNAIKDRLTLAPRLTFAMLTFSLPPGKDNTCCCQHNHDGYVTSEEAQIEPAIADKPTNAKSEQ